MADEETPATEEDAAVRKNAASRFFGDVHERIVQGCSGYRRLWRWAGFGLLHTFIVAHFAWATIYFAENAYPDWDWPNGYGLLVVLLAFIYLVTFYMFVYAPYASRPIREGLRPCCQRLGLAFERQWLRWTLYMVVLLAICVFLVLDSWHQVNRLVAIAGFFLILLFGFVFSKHPGEIRARPLFCGLFAQFVLGLVTIRWEPGRLAFMVIGDKVAVFLNCADNGSSFVYGSQLVVQSPTFAFKALSVIFFLSLIVQVLYYYGVMQQVVMTIGMWLHRAVGTTIAESVNAAANIFMGMTEAPLLLQPYLHDLTRSELHAVMAAGFASVAGTVLAAYISYGANPAHLITASVLSAPAALCYSKLFYPETEVSRSTADTIVMPQSEAQGVLDAAVRGASAAIDLVLGIIANTIAFISVVALINTFTRWLGALVGYPHLTIEYGLGYLFMPVSYLMGVPWNESLVVGRLIATKTMVNEFVAYAQLGELKRPHGVDDGTRPVFTKRAEAIATYAICGFSNPGSVGIMIGGLTVLAPSKRDDVVLVVGRAFLSGIMACFLTACVAGILLQDEKL